MFLSRWISMVLLKGSEWIVIPVVFFWGREGQPWGRSCRYFPSPLGSQRAAVLTEISPLYFRSLLSQYGLHGLQEWPVALSNGPPSGTCSSNLESAVVMKAWERAGRDALCGSWGRCVSDQKEVMVCFGKWGLDHHICNFFKVSLYFS